MDLTKDLVFGHRIAGVPVRTTWHVFQYPVPFQREVHGADGDGKRGVSHNHIAFQTADRQECVRPVPLAHMESALT